MVLDIADVMHQAVTAHGPSPGNEEIAVQAAMHAAERYITGLGLGNASINMDELRSAAIGAWNLYCEQALEEPFQVTSVCRKDLVLIGATKAQALLLSDKDMRTIARRMGDDYVIDGDFWTTLGIVSNRRFEEYDLQIDFSDTPHE